MREYLQEQGYEQIPQFSSMNPIDVSHKFDLVPDTKRGTKRSVMIGINYVGKLFAALDLSGGDRNFVRSLLYFAHGI